ncbi:MAG: 2,3-bisphosphoglycerate-independent phosphoglycerate mutase [Firmicutes bacterium]|nr:2,3-bisphosphoglycerate-independent phosphoglycerate mutase [Bacillota bacterium]
MKKILTIIFDGFGIRQEEDGNAVKAAQMHTFEEFWEKYPHSILSASEEAVGLLPGQMGNSEIGHMTIGAGRLIKSNIDKITDFFKTAEENEVGNLLLANPSRRIHLMGLCSDGKIHSTIDHFIAMYDLLVQKGFKEIYFHVITDGRDTKVDVAYNFINQIEQKINENGIGKIASVCGRYYAMDRDSNFDRTKLYYDLVTRGVGVRVLNIEMALKSSYAKGVTDEFIKPILLEENGTIKENDILIWMNFRADRTKQILSAFVDPKFSGFDVKQYENLDVYSWYKLDKNIKTNVFIDEDTVENPLGIYLSRLGLRQARVAESEKFPHVTYFFDGGYNGKIDNCDKFHIPSPEVATYDQKPEMSAVAVTRKIMDCMEKDYDFIFANFANPDMVGHTGNLDATTKACMALDVCLNKIIESAEDNFYTIVLMADHGNADTMYNEDGSVCTTHSLAKVPFIIADSKVVLKENGDLTNVAPTILDYMDISIPIQMTADSLITEE